MGESPKGFQVERDEIRVSSTAAWAGGATSWPESPLGDQNGSDQLGLKVSTS